MITILKSWVEGDYLQSGIYALAEGQVVKYATNVDYETINHRIALYKPGSVGNFAVYYCPVGSPQYAEFGCNSICIVTNIAIITGTPTVTVSGTRQLACATTGGTWSSSDVTKATVNSSGLVTGVSAGTTTIKYTTTYGYVSLVVTVSA